MPTAPGPVSPGPTPSLFGSVRTFWRVLLASLHGRLELLFLELGEEAYRALYLVIAVLVGVLFLHCAFFFAMLWLLAAVWDTQYRLWVIGGIFLLYFLVGAISLLIARNMVTSRPKFLGHTMDELRRDVEGLQMAIKSTEKES